MRETISQEETAAQTQVVVAAVQDIIILVGMLEREEGVALELWCLGIP
jgi:hypothetical protein